MYGTGFLPTEEHEFYRIERDDLYLVGTSEVALAALHSDEILRGAASYPLRPASPRASGGRPGPTARTPRASSVFTSSIRSSSSRSHPEASWDEYTVIRANQGGDP